MIFLLAMTEITPVMLMAQTLPVLLRRSGASLEEVGSLYLVMSPWALKFLWAPLVDRYGSEARGRYRSWLLVVHPLLIAVVLGLAWVDLPLLLLSNRALAFLLLAVLTVVSATADTAADGLAIGLLSAEERGAGNGFQMAGSMMGNLVGGGLLLISLQYLGWRNSLSLLAALLLVPLAFVYLYREPPAAPRPPLSWREVAAPLLRPKLRRWLVLVAVIEASYAIAYTPMQALLSDQGLSLEEVGLVLGVLGSLAGTLGGALGGVSVKRFGRRRSFFGGAVLTALGVLSLSFATAPGVSRWLLYATVEAAIFGIMALGTVLYTMMMDRARGHLASSDYTLQYCALQLASFSAMALGGFLAESLGARGVFLLAPALVLLVFGSASRLLSPHEFSAEPYPPEVPPAQKP
jgi:MFS family permease